MLMAGMSGIMGFVLNAYLSCGLPQYPVPCPPLLPCPESPISTIKSRNHLLDLAACILHAQCVFASLFHRLLRMAAANEWLRLLSV